ncbi:PREDICTED: uncharacterized protein LOC105460678 [Wasmannia auropunctata]|uniref:uncharacterized protein LOC105460678 n=1 Tax=Wasmannia auropunctata TaxID=64793 RepID=UPI0005EE03FD|nr:PREDICTED: uncharacterized protein LOC105460678 [Wasmannia auropunctata]XP_011705478.1 PREDICTED: uncharacterized protein LOC105460678 [Wasmannia auropunctata]XP_011705479.1 PREDICTED: uncharacterized protein LOC105460678 [Wasmannia auropunctata]XP_011705480.1 PREDICTED: uncharacterized protein LOC105460678 [Wasmannia auropunctata]
MALNTLPWLNQCFVEKILRKSESDDSIQAINVFSNPGSNKGDNYMCDIVRITAEFSREQEDRMIVEKKSIILKVSPTSESVRFNWFTQADFFRTETSMMLDTLDKMNKLLGPKHRLSGKGLYMQNEHPSLLAIEDLMPLGFRMTDLTGLDLAHSILVLHGLARFHAASVAVCEKEPKQKEMYTRGLFNNQNPSETKDFFNRGTKALSEEIVNWPEVKKYSEKIAKLSDHIYQIATDAAKLSENEFNVINHGDSHLKNMLFKYDNDSNPTDQIFVDFQASVYTSPAVDFLYFLNSSLSLDVFENKKNVLLNEYFSTLLTTMKQLNCKTKPPTTEELKDAIKRRTSLEMVSSFAVLPLMLCPKTEAKDFDEMMTTGTWINPGLKSEEFKKFMIKNIPLYDEWGLLDL